MTTFDAVLRAQLRRDPGRPLVTWYDHATGERVELSVTTYANWVAKAASLLVEEGDLERGMRLRIDLPTHWLGPVFLGAAWTVGLVVTTDDDPDAVVCGPDTLESGPRGPTTSWCSPAACCRSASASPTPVPAGVHDVGLEIWSQPDAFAPWDPPTAQDAATDGAYGDATQGALMEAAAAGSLLTDGGRLFSMANPASPPGIATFTEPLVRGGSLVLVRHPDPGGSTRRTPRNVPPTGPVTRGLSPTGPQPARSKPSIPLAEVARGGDLAARARVEVDVARAGPAHDVVAAPLARMSLTPTTQSKPRRSLGRPAVAGDLAARATSWPAPDPGPPVPA